MKELETNKQLSEILKIWKKVISISFKNRQYLKITLNIILL